MSKIEKGDLVVVKGQLSDLYTGVIGIVINVEDQFYKSKYIAWQNRYTVYWSNGEKTHEPHNFIEKVEYEEKDVT